MTRTKRMTAAVLTLVLLLNFAGCGAKNALFDRVSGFDARRSFRERLRNLHRNGGFNGERAGIRKHARDDCVHAGTRADSGGNVERLRAILPH